LIELLEEVHEYAQDAKREFEQLITQSLLLNCGLATSRLAGWHAARQQPRGRQRGAIFTSTSTLPAQRFIEWSIPSATIPEVNVVNGMCDGGPRLPNARVETGDHLTAYLIY
jgi:hypothetical protein